jgi:hypothetical protein
MLVVLTLFSNDSGHIILTESIAFFRKRNWRTRIRYLLKITSSFSSSKCMAGRSYRWGSGIWIMYCYGSKVRTMIRLYILIMNQLNMYHYKQYLLLLLLQYASCTCWSNMTVLFFLRPTVEEVNQWAQSLDKLLSHKCKCHPLSVIAHMIAAWLYETGTKVIG